MWRARITQWLGDTALAVVVLNLALMLSGVGTHHDEFTAAGVRLLLVAPLLALIAAVVGTEASSRGSARVVLALYGTLLLAGAVALLSLRTI